MGRWLAHSLWFILALSFEAQASQEACRRFGGQWVVPHLQSDRPPYCSCRGITITNYADPANARRCLGETIRLTNGVVEGMTVGRERAQGCGQSFMSYEANPFYGCPNRWFEIIDDNRNRGNGVLGLGSLLPGPGIQAAIEACPDQLTVRAGGQLAAQNLEQMLAHDPHFALSAPDDLITRCLDEARPNISAEERSNTVGEWYFAMNRLKSAEIGTIRALADADALLGQGGDELWTRRMDNCWDNRFPETVMVCRSQAQCAGRAGRLQRLRAEVQEILPLYLELSQALRETSGNDCGHTRMVRREAIIRADELEAMLLCREERDEKVKRLRDAMALFEARQPFLASRDFMGHFSRSESITDERIEQALKQEYREQREDLRQRLSDLQKASRCLSGGVEQGECSPSDIDALVGQAPSVTRLDPSAYQGAEGARHGMVLNQVIGRMECLADTRANARTGDGIINELALDTVVTAATVGIGTTFSALARAGRTVQGTVQGYRALDTARQLSLAFRGSVMAVQTMRKLYNSGTQAVDACRSELGATPQEASRDGMSCLEQDIGEVANSSSMSGWECVSGLSLAALDLTGGMTKFKSAGGMLGRFGKIAERVERYGLRWQDTVANAALSRLTGEARERTGRLARLMMMPIRDARRALVAGSGRLSTAERRVLFGKLDELGKEVRKRLYKRAKAEVMGLVDRSLASPEENEALARQAAEAIALSEGGNPDQYLIEARQLVESLSQFNT